MAIDRTPFNLLTDERISPPGSIFGKAEIVTTLLDPIDAAILAATTGRLKTVDGTAALPAYSFTSEATLGFWRPVAGTVLAQGNFAVSGALSAQGSLYLAGLLQFGTGTSTGLSAPADGQLVLRNSASTSGVGLDLNTDTVLKVRTRAQSAYGTIDCLGLRASGVAGASKAAGPVASITVVNGIVTACT